jgi:hypothetical protein
MLAAVAASTGISLIDDSMPFGTLATLYVPVFVLYLLAPALGDGFGVLGIGFTLWTLRPSECGPGVSGRTMLVVLGVLALVALVNVVTRVGRFPIPRLLPKRRAGPASALLLFGILDIAIFIASPNGLEIWADAPAWATPAVMGLLIFIAFVGSYAPEFVLGLVAIGAVVGHVFLTGIELDLVQGASTACGNPTRELLWAAGFAAVATIALALRKSSRVATQE